MFVLSPMRIQISVKPVTTPQLAESVAPQVKVSDHNLLLLRLVQRHQFFNLRYKEMTGPSPQVMNAEFLQPTLHLIKQVQRIMVSSARIVILRWLLFLTKMNAQLEASFKPTNRMR